MTPKGKVGPSKNTDGVEHDNRIGKTGEAITADAHPIYYEANSRGTVFQGGMTLTSVSNATFSVGTLDVTCTPIIGVYNPLGSGKNLVILQAKILPVNTALQTTGAGALVWATSVNNAAITTGNNPLNMSTLLPSGSVAKSMSGVALTGMTTNLQVRFASSLGSGNMSNLSTLQTAAGLMPNQVPSVELINGGIIVPPGGVLALLCTTNAPVAVSMASAILWEEVDVI